MRRILCGLAVAAGLAIPASASALTQGQATSRAASAQYNACGTWSWDCTNPYDRYPWCGGPYANAAYATQWDCTGTFVERNVFTQADKYCNVETRWDPYGRRLYFGEGCWG